MNEELNAGFVNGIENPVEQVEAKEEEKVEIGEPVYEVKAEEFICDYKELLVKKEEDLKKGYEELDKRVAEKLEALRPEIVEEVKKEIEKEIEDSYAEKIGIYEKYIVEIKKEEAPVVEEVEPQVAEGIENGNVEAVTPVQPEQPIL